MTDLKKCFATTKEKPRDKTVDPNMKHRMKLMASTENYSQKENNIP